MRAFRRERVRKVAVGVLTLDSGERSVFRFTKRDRIVNVQVQPEERAKAYIRFADLLRAEIYEPGTTTVKPIHDFTRYYGP